MNQTTLSIAHRLDNPRVSDVDRQTAEKFMHYGECLADLVCRAGEYLRSAAMLLCKPFVHRAW